MNNELIDTMLKKAARLEHTNLPADTFMYYKHDIERFVVMMVDECVRVTIDNVGNSEKAGILKLYEHFGVE